MHRMNISNDSARVIHFFHIHNQGLGYMEWKYWWILNIWVFKERPPHPPSKAQMLALQNVHEEHYGRSLLNLFKNVGFDILTITYG